VNSANTDIPKITNIEHKVHYTVLQLHLKIYSKPHKEC